MIGIFDSGVGGMTVARAVEKLLPAYKQIYLGDLARMPYGTKSAETITRYAVENVEFLLGHGARIIIVACNSAASAAAAVLQNKFAVPIFEVITPAIAEAIAATSAGRIGVIGTSATIKSGVYEEKIKHLAPACKVFSQACPLLVPLVEEGWFNKRETKMIVRRYLQPLKMRQVDTLVLGCTHYPLLKDLIQYRIGKKKVRLIDSSAAVANNLKDFLDRNPEVDKTLVRDEENLYYVSDVTPAAELTARHIFGRRIELVKI